MARRQLPWSMVCAEMGGDRTARPEIREERIAVRGLHRPVPLTLTAWRGRSGRRHVCTVHPVSEGALIEGPDLVVLAVHRRTDGIAEIIQVDGDPARWLPHAAQMCLVTEIHVYRLAESRSHCQAVVMDLLDPNTGPLANRRGSA